MNSLTTDPADTTLRRLFTEAQAADATLAEDMFEGIESQEAAISRMLEAETQDYRAVAHRVAGNFLAVSPEFGRFLYMCARGCQARTVVEFGTSFGISTIHLAAAVRDNGGGQVIGTELEPSKAERARAHLTEADLADLVDIRVGDALETLREVGGPVDLVLLDGSFTLYRPVLDLLEPHLRPGAFVIGENAFEGTGYLEYVRDPSNGYLSLVLPFGVERGNELSIRTR
ncbi:O-methyltransferase [Nocardia callitridis]|uniref:O-methyltransferase n=1 Tax=Nocardia callitridis TaxID=648753 RepID=A0ABP9JR28_9NOCA